MKVMTARRPAIVAITRALVLSDIAWQGLAFVPASLHRPCTGTLLAAPTRAKTQLTTGRGPLRCRHEDSVICCHGEGNTLTSASARILTLLEARKSAGEEEERAYLPGSGLRGVDTNKLTGNERRDADWFERTAARESRGELQWFENPVAYGLLFVGVTVAVFGWAVAACFIPGYCPVN